MKLKNYLKFYYIMINKLKKNCKFFMQLHMSYAIKIYIMPTFLY